MTLHLVSNFHCDTWQLHLLRSPHDTLKQLQKEGVGKSCNPFPTPVIEGDRLSAPRPSLFTPGKPRYPLWASGSFRTGTENADAHGIRSPDRVARIKSLRRPASRLTLLKGKGKVTPKQAYVALRGPGG
jgi:hypothetical protein